MPNFYQRLLTNFRRSLLFGLFIPVPFASYAAPQGQAGTGPVRLIQDALRSGDAMKADALAKADLKRFSQDPRLWALDGMALAALKKDTEALAAYKHALQVSPDFRAALEGSAQILFQRGDPAGIPTLQRLIILAPANLTTHAMLGSLEYRQKNFQEAVKEFLLAGEVIAQSPDALLQYGASLGEVGDFGRSADVLGQALALQPEQQLVRYNLALAQWHAGKGDAALKSLRPLLDDARNTSEIHSLAAQIYEQQEDVPAAVEELRAAIRLDPADVDNYLEFAKLSYKYRSSDAGIEMINAGLSQLPKSAPLYTARGILNAQLSKFDEAFADFEQANTLDPSSAFGTLARGVGESAQQNKTAAIASFRQRIKAHPNDALAHYLLAEDLSESNGVAMPALQMEAIAQAESAASLDNSMIAAHDLLAMLYLRVGNVNEAIVECRRALQLQPADEPALYHLIQALRRVGNKQEAMCLVPRLAAVHQAAQADDSAHKHYKLLTSNP